VKVHRVAAAAVVFLGVSAFALRASADTASVATSGASPSPSASASASQSDAPAQAPAAIKAPAFPGLFGDFDGGERSALAKRGFTLNGHLVTESAANLSGGFPLGGTAHERGTGLSTEFGFGFDLDFDKLYANSGAGTLHFLLTTRFGSNLSSEAIGDLSSVEEIYGDGQTTRITFLDYEQPLLKKKLNLRLGKYNQQNDFIAGSTYWGGNLYCFYQNNNICGTPSGIPVNNGVVSNGSEGYTYYPSSEWGVRLRANLSERLYVQGAAIQANPLVNNANGGLYLGFNGGDGTELPVEIGVTLKNRAGDLDGNVRVGGYYDTSNVQDYASRARGNITLLPYETSAAGLASNAAALATIDTRYARGRSGAYIQTDHLIEGQSGAGKRGTAFFASFEYSDPQTSLLSTMYDAGIVRHGTFAGRPNDTIAAAFASQDYNVRLQRLESALQAQGYVVPLTTHDQVFELTYGLQATSWFTLRSGLQLVIDPGGIQASPRIPNPSRNALVIDLGGYFTL
jgi:porin